MRGDAGVLAKLRQQVERHHQLFARARQRVALDAVDMHQRVVEFGPTAIARLPGMVQGVVVQITTEAPTRSCAVRRQHREAHPDRRAGVVVVLDLRLGQRGLLDRRPHHRAQAAIQRAVQQELADLARRSRLRSGGPWWRSARASCPRRPGGGTPPSARPANARHRRGTRRGTAAPGRRPCPLRLAVLLLDLPLDRQAVAVPAGDVVGVVAGHLARAVDDVLVDLVQRGADMDVAVRVGRAVMQDELRPPSRRGAQARP